jgi:hypothetical protein
MGKADPKSLLILALVTAAALFGALSLRRAMLADRDAQRKTFLAPESFQGAPAYQGADTIDDLARDICGPETWYPALVQDSEIFFYAMQGGDPAHIADAQRFSASSHDLAMKYCKVHSAQIASCGESFATIAAGLRDEDLTEQTMQDAHDALGVQGCGILRMTINMDRQGETMISHHVLAGLVDDRWRVLLFLPSAL